MSWEIHAKENVVEGDSGITKMEFGVLWTSKTPFLENTKEIYVNLELHHITTDGGDVYPVKYQITLKPNSDGEIGGTFEVDIRGDEKYEGDETFEIELTSAAWIGHNGTTKLQTIGLKETGTIVDDDDPTPSSPPVHDDSDFGFGGSGKSGDGSDNASDDGADRPQPGDSNDDAQPDGSSEKPANDGASGSEFDLAAPPGWKPGGPTVEDKLGFDPVEVFHERLKEIGVYPTEPNSAPPGEDKPMENLSEFRQAPMISDAVLTSDSLDITDVFVFSPVITGSSDAFTFDPGVGTVTGGPSERPPLIEDNVGSLEPLPDQEMESIPIENFDFFG